MKSVPRIGTVGTEIFVVTEQHLIDFSGNGMPAILSTPWLIWFLEHAARNAVLPHLDAGESTVGARVDVSHTAPVALGQRVECRARVIYTDGPAITFQLEAFDSCEQIARGTHKLHVIDAARLARRVQKKVGRK